MKKIVTVCILTMFLTACCGTKKAIETQSKEPKEIAEVIPPKAPKTPKVIETPTAETPKKSEVEVKEEDILYAEDVQVDYVTPKPVEAFDHSTFDDLLQKHVSKQGNVNYNGFTSDRATLRNYISSLGDNMPNNNWTREDKLAYWINAYNAMTIDLILRNPSEKSIKDIDKPWDQRLWKLGRKWYNLDEIEHQILRKMNEPRIHFAIVCASVSCPKLQNTAFTAVDLESQITNATKEFLSDSSKNNLSKNSIKLSKIFKWFAKDFKQNQTLIDFLNKYSDIDISQNASKSYMDYNWNLND